MPLDRERPQQRARTKQSKAAGLSPAHHPITVFQTGPSWNYTTFLNIAALALAAVLGWRFLRTGGVEMLRAMESAPEPGHEMVHHHHDHGHHHDHH